MTNIQALVVVYPEKVPAHAAGREWVGETTMYVVESTTVRDPRLYRGARLSNETIVDLVTRDIVVLVHKEGAPL